MQKIPFLHYSTLDRPVEEGFETWRTLMAPMYEIKPVRNLGIAPGGSTMVYSLGDFLLNRTIFSAQSIKRDRKRVEATPDHFLFQCWRTGGYVGEVAGQNVTVSRGMVAIADHRRGLDGIIGRGDMLGIIVPREIVAGIDVEAHGWRLDPSRTRLLTARIATLYRQLPQTDAADVAELTGEMTSFLRRVLDRSSARDVLEGAELDGGLLPLARCAIQAHLANRDLSAGFIAGVAGVSRATLYRLFAPLGGVMAYVGEQRLLAVRDALSDPLEMRSLTRLAEDYGIKSPSQLSRSFYARFGCSPRAFREQHRELIRMRGGDDIAAFWAQFLDLGG